VNEAGNGGEGVEGSRRGGGGADRRAIEHYCDCWSCGGGRLVARICW